MPKWTLFYDGGCNLCHLGRLRIEDWAPRAGIDLRVEVLQSAEAIGKGYGDAMVLEVDGKPLFGAEAWIETLGISPMPFRMARWIPRPLLRLGYGLVARYRYRIFGRRSCPIPPKSVPR